MPRGVNPNKTRHVSVFERSAAILEARRALAVAQGYATRQALRAAMEQPSAVSRLSPNQQKVRGYDWHPGRSWPK